MSHRKPTKTKFNDDWRDDAACVEAVSADPGLKTAWDNIDHGTWEKDDYRPDPQENVAKAICFACKAQSKCLKDAIKDNESEGIRGGYRFERGAVSKEDAFEIFDTFGYRTKVRKRTDMRYVNLPEVRSND